MACLCLLFVAGSQHSLVNGFHDFKADSGRNTSSYPWKTLKMIFFPGIAAANVKETSSLFIYIYIIYIYIYIFLCVFFFAHRIHLCIF